MNKLKYTIVNGYFDMNCPYKVKHKTGYILRLGSVGCCKCEYCKGDNTETKTISCSYKESTDDIVEF